jgi:predicted transposase YbfD/YdcC
MNLEFDMTDFNRVMKQYLKVNARENAELINKKASQFTAVAINRTITAGGAKTGAKTTAQGRRNIERELRQPRNDGNSKGHRRWKNLGEAIIQQAVFKRRGKYYSDAELNTQFSKLLNARKNKVNFLKSGWFPALRKLNREAIRAKYVSKDFIDKFVAQERRKAAMAGVYAKGKDKGSATVATAFKQFATITNSVHVGQKHIVSAAKSALEYVRRDLLAYIAKKKQQTINNFRSK